MTVLHDPAVHTPPAPREAELFDYLEVLWRWRYVILATALASGLLALVVSFAMAPRYTATATLLLTQAKFGEDEAAASPTGIENFRRLLASRRLADELVTAEGLHQAPHFITGETFVRRHLHISTPDQTSLIDVAVTLPDPDLAARVANRLGSLAMQMSRQISQHEDKTVRELLREQLDHARTRLDALQGDFLALRGDAQLEVRRGDIDVLLAQRADLARLEVDIRAVRGRLARAEAELARREQILTTSRTFDADPALTEAARMQGRAGLDLLELRLRDESLNPVYETLDELVAVTRAELAALEGRRTQLTGRRLSGAQLPAMTELYAQELAVDRLAKELELARTVYGDLFIRYEQATVQLASRSADLQVVVPAAPPGEPSSPRIVLNVLLALAAGFVLACVGAFLADYVRSREPPARA